MNPAALVRSAFGSRGVCHDERDTGPSASHDEPSCQPRRAQGGGYPGTPRGWAQGGPARRDVTTSGARGCDLRLLGQETQRTGVLPDSPYIQMRLLAQERKRTLVLPVVPHSLSDIVGTQNNGCVVVWGEGGLCVVTCHDERDTDRAHLHSDKQRGAVDPRLVTSGELPRGGVS